MLKAKSQTLQVTSIKHFTLQSTIFWFVLWLFTVLNNFQVYSANNTSFNWQLFFSWNAPYYMIMIGASPLIYLLYHTYSKTNYTRQFVFHIVAALLLALIQQLGLNLYLILTEPVQVNEPNASFFGHLKLLYQVGLIFSVTGFLFYMLGLGLVISLDIYQRFRQKEKANFALETALNKAQFDTLQSQLQPHFLFNTFNSLSMMARQKKHQEVVNMIAMVSNLLRETLSLEDKQQVSLERELVLVNHYLNIEQVRFRDRLSIILEIAEETKQCNVPVLFMQPIIENAFQHGIGKTEGPAALTINSTIVDKELVIHVINSGPSLPADWTLDENMSIGLNNVLQRLDHAYGENCAFSIGNHTEKNGVIVTIKLPV